ncbi:MAG: 16S rRNA (cytosine(1402)-N(4))-methyltransferase RsmH [Sedimentisphaerales bacterium]|nr:16S rRNA (cytosine(1402)-N(4))-methyltransferase RsmH [Sedimentisphaerales bacterium]
MNNMPAQHLPVLAEFAGRIDLKADAVVVDATVGAGGHSSIFAQSLTRNGVLLGLDVDTNCLAIAREKLAAASCKVLLVRSNFANLAEVARQNGIEKADLIFADLGVCSAQLADENKGLSFSQNSKLDMRLDDRLESTAADIVNRRDEKGLADLIYGLGQERASRKIARSIVQYRQKKSIDSTAELVNIICQALRCDPNSRRSKIHPATKTFQALRIAVNSELENLEKLLSDAPNLLKTGGKIAVISFHSLEDRIVKTNFRENKAAGVYEIVTKKPITASRDEQKENPRCRSAKLRMAVKV